MFATLCSVNLDIRIESPIAITADPLFVFIIIGAFTTVISFQVGIHRPLKLPESEF